MRFELLECLERMNIGVGVVEADHIADSHQVVLRQVVAETSAVGFEILFGRTENVS